MEGRWPREATYEMHVSAETIQLGEAKRAGSLGDLFLEIYQAVCGGQLRLAVMGVRALIEQVMIHKVGDNGSFVKNLDAFQKAGYISL